jgi:hypothetical protein
MSRKTAKVQPAERVKGFTVEVDGKLYGPFPEKEKRQFIHLIHKKGVNITPVWLDKASLSLSLKSLKDVSKSILRFLTAWNLRPLVG